MELAKRVESLESRLRRLEAIEAIKQLRWDYSRACDDNHNSARLIRMFTEDAALVLNPPFFGTIRTLPSKICSTIMPSATGSRGFLHYYLQPLITVAEDCLSAEGTWYLWELAKMPDGNRREEPVRVAGEYFDSYVAQDGRWKFARIEVNVRLLSPYQDGWVKNMIRSVLPK